MTSCKTRLVTLLHELNNENLIDYEGEYEELFKHKYEKIVIELNCSIGTILEKTLSVTKIYESERCTNEWNYVCLNFYILELLNDELSKSEMEVLSVKETKSVKNSLRGLMTIGILKNLQPNLPHFVKIRGYSESDIIYTYNLLKCTTFGFCHYMKYPNLRMMILPEFLQGILVALFQIAYCPLKKPTNTDDKTRDKFVVTTTIYEKFIEDQESFKKILSDIQQSVHPAIFIKETMVLFQTNSPVWFKKTVSNSLTKIMRSGNGIEHIAAAMLDGYDDDSTKTWKILDILTKLIMSCRKFPDFRDNICSQVVSLLESAKSTNRDLLIFERLVVSCTKALYHDDADEGIFLNRITIPLLYLANKEHRFRENQDLTDDIKQSVRLIYGAFVDNSANSQCLPIELLKVVINVVFHLYHLTLHTTFNTTNRELGEVLKMYIKTCTSNEMNHLFDSFLFGFETTDIPQLRNDVVIEVETEIIVKQSQHTIIHATAETTDTIFNLLTAQQKVILFGYLLQCITKKQIYFPASSNKELLEAEDDSTCTVLQRLLTVHKLLSQLAESKEVQNSLREQPDDIVKYISNVLASDSDDSQFIFIIVMILDNLVSNCSINTIAKYQILLEPLSQISTRTRNKELMCYCDKITAAISEKKVKPEPKPTKEVTELDKALEDICDPLLPVRGHGLLRLTKLIEKRDKHAMERKQYLLNLFQLQLKNEDSFIYLNAVQGLAAMADVFPDTILEVLCEEYADFKKNDQQESRMKLGEVLVRVVKLLGDMAPKYKALLLNTFLAATKDDDHLIRASSLSNLGEVCRVLNYKLGTIVTEVLVCVHAIIATDKAAEARRAAVTVIRQLFVGLQTEMISFLKDDILPIYRTLKEIYYHDKDDVMRLQAQLALEELNENMKSFIFPNPRISFEKKVIMLD